MQTMLKQHLRRSDCATLLCFVHDDSECGTIPLPQPLTPLSVQYDSVCKMNSVFIKMGKGQTDELQTLCLLQKLPDE